MLGRDAFLEVFVKAMERHPYLLGDRLHRPLCDLVGPRLSDSRVLHVRRPRAASLYLYLEAPEGGLVVGLQNDASVAQTSDVLNHDLADRGNLPPLPGHNMSEVVAALCLASCGRSPSRRRGPTSESQGRRQRLESRDSEECRDEHVPSSGPFWMSMPSSLWPCSPAAC